MSRRYTQRTTGQTQSTRRARNVHRLRGPKRVNKVRRQTEQFPTLPALLAYFAYLNATKPQCSPDVTVSRTLIIVVGLVLVVVALVAVGSPNAVVDVIKHWPLIP